MLMKFPLAAEKKNAPLEMLMINTFVQAGSREEFAIRNFDFFFFGRQLWIIASVGAMVVFSKNSTVK